MRSFVVYLGLCVLTSANIIFKHAPLKCNKFDKRPNHGCITSYECLSNEGDNIYTCQAPLTHAISPASSTGELKSGHASEKKSSSRAVGALSKDGKCGSQNGGLLCNPSSTVYTGTCCSQYGWCGNTPAHCLISNGCQSGCSSTTLAPLPSPTSATTPRADGQCGKAFGGATCDPKGPFGGCCSQYGYCGTTPAHCLVANGCQNGCTASPAASSSQEPVIKPTSVPGSDAVTTDGTCGALKGNTVCGNWPQGSCCSMYGYCGNTAAHCGDGCQSGPCTSAPAGVAPGPKPAPVATNRGVFNIVGQAGVPPMHAALMPNGRVVFLDKIENYTQLRLPNGEFAYSSEYNPSDNTVVPLAYKTNAFCSGGAFLPDGRVISVGGNAPLTWLDPTVADGFDAIRYLGRSSSDTSLNGQPWSEPGNKLASKRWYATVQAMPDGTMFVASGSLNGLDPTLSANNNPTYEVLSSSGVSKGANIPLSILQKNQPYYMYPFVHLLSDGSLFVFVSKSAEQISVASNAVVRTYPDLSGMFRTYPNTGGSVQLAASSSNSWSSDILICGGGAYQDITSPTEPSCGRISPLSGTPNWEMDSMPEGRGMVEATMLPDGTILWLNGANQGSQGFGLARAPTLEGLLYDPTKTLGSRWSTLASSSIPRLYHSVALLLLDGTVMVAGSNPVEMPVLNLSASTPFVTEFRVENYVPPYLQGTNANKRPINIILSSKLLSSNGSTFGIKFTAPAGVSKVSVALYHGGFVTHSLHMGARMAQLDNTGFTAGSGAKSLTVKMPPNRNVAPPGPYVVYVLCDGVPGMGQFVSVS